MGGRGRAVRRSSVDKQFEHYFCNKGDNVIGLVYSGVMFESSHRKLNNLLPVGLSRPELIATLAECHRLAKHSEERCLAYTAAIDALDDHGADAATVTRDLTHRSARQAKQVADTATQLASMPLMAAALARGEIGTEHVVAAANAAKRVSPEEADQLVDDAVAVPADLFLKRTRQWIGQHETADEIEDRYQRQRSQREARWGVGNDRMLHLHAVLDPVSGRELVAALDRRVDFLWRADGGREGTPDDVRSPRQRRADALLELVTTESAGNGRVHPKHMVIMHLDIASGTAEFTDHEPVPASVLADLGPKAEVVGMVYNGDGQPLHLGRAARLASRAQWIALIDRDRGCLRCGADPSRCDAHHVHEYSTGGATDIDNLELDCHGDHALIHQHGFDPRRQPANRGVG